MFKNSKRSGKKKKHLLFLFFVGGGVSLLVLGALIMAAFYLTEIPSLKNLNERKIAESTKIYDQTGQTLLWEIHGEEKRTIVPFDNISRHIKNATVAIEDSSFYIHGGVRPLSILRVLFLNIFEGKKIGSGGSTITQQLVKNVLLTSEQTITRKIREMIIAVKLEATYSKDEILDLYLNEIPYGSNAYGVETASETYFNKKSQDVTLAEAAYLAALPQAPSFYSPYGNHRNDLENRKNLVLSRMKDIGFIDEAEYNRAREEKVQFQAQQRGGIRAPHFVMYVRELLNEKYGEDRVERGGLKVITTLDIKLQEKAEDVIAKGATSNKTKFRAANAGLVALDPKTGRILAMVGSRDYFDIEHEGNFNVTLAKRQPGSAFKPIVYATAFKRGYTPDTILFDVEINFSVIPGRPYTPNNYDGKFRGPISMRNALAQSLNVPGVQTLYLAGMSNVLSTAQDMGISTLTDPARYGLTLVLGGGEVTLLELSSAYGVFANRGTKTSPHPIIEVKDNNGKVLEEENIATRHVIDENIADTINSILSDNDARTPIFGARSALYFESGNVAVKTGTTNDFRDAWAVGYSPNIVVGTWAGNNDNSAMTKNVAGFVIAPMWHEYMDFALGSVAKEVFTPPIPLKPEKPVLRGIWRGSRSYFIDKISGKLATEFTPESQKEERIIQQIHSILYWISKDDPDGSIPDHPETDSQFYNWEVPVRIWAQKMNIKDDDNIPIPTEYDSTHSPENWPQINLDTSKDDLIFKRGETLVFYPQITGTYPVTETSLFIDGEFTKSIRGDTHTVSINPDSPHIENGLHTLTLRVYDAIGNRQEKDFSFTVEAL